MTRRIAILLAALPAPLAAHETGAVHFHEANWTSLVLGLVLIAVGGGAAVVARSRGR